MEDPSRTFGMHADHLDDVKYPRPFWSQNELELQDADDANKQEIDYARLYYQRVDLVRKIRENKRNYTLDKVSVLQALQVICQKGDIHCSRRI